MKLIKEFNQEASQFIKDQVIQFNRETLPDEVKTPVENFSFVIRDEQDKIAAGIIATAFWGHLHIDYLWVHAKLRGEGYGEMLVTEIEKTAREKGYHSISLDSFSFQAPNFYKKQGFTELGVIENHPVGYSQHYLVKYLM